MDEAQFYIQLENQTLRCELCPWLCVLNPGQTGNCRVRRNESGILVTLVYNKIAAFGTDPIEKKPLYHFYPGRNILSIGEVGCNLHCNFCQNYRISQCFATEFAGFTEITSEQIVAKALQLSQNIGIAYTYNEPFTFYEFMHSTAQLAHSNKLKNAIVSNGYVNPEPLKKILPFIDAFNIDLKAFSDGFYRKQTKGKLEPVLLTLKTIAKSPAHLEITNLVIPGLNDAKTQFEEMVKWVANELGEHVPLHLSRYFPQYKMDLPPTKTETMEMLYEIAKQQLHHVYLGNVTDERRSSTYCTGCREVLIWRNRYSINVKNISSTGCCTNCGTSTNIIL